MNQLIDRNKLEDRTIYIFQKIKSFGLGMEDLAIYSRTHHPFSVPTNLKLLSSSQKEKVVATIKELLYCSGQPLQNEISISISTVSSVIDEVILRKLIR